MAKDPYGNYEVVLPEPVLPDGPSIGIVLFGKGAPSSTPLPWQALYTDETTGKVYANQNGTWILAGGSPAQVCIIGGVGPPAVPVPCAFSAYVQQPGPNFGLWVGDLVDGWGVVQNQGP